MLNAEYWKLRLGQPLGEVEITLRQRPQVRGAQVVPFDGHPLLALHLTRTTGQAVQLCDQVCVVRGMAVAQEGRLAAELHLSSPYWRSVSSSR